MTVRQLKALLEGMNNNALVWVMEEDGPKTLSGLSVCFQLNGDYKSVTVRLDTESGMFDVPPKGD